MLSSICSSQVLIKANESFWWVSEKREHWNLAGKKAKEHRMQNMSAQLRMYCTLFIWSSTQNHSYTAFSMQLEQLSAFLDLLLLILEAVLVLELKAAYDAADKTATTKDAASICTDTKEIPAVTGSLRGESHHKSQIPALPGLGTILQSNVSIKAALLIISSWNPTWVIIDIVRKRRNQLNQLLADDGKRPLLPHMWEKRACLSEDHRPGPESLQNCTDQLWSCCHFSEEDTVRKYSCSETPHITVPDEPPGNQCMYTTTPDEMWGSIMLTCCGFTFTKQLHLT